MAYSDIHHDSSASNNDPTWDEQSEQNLTGSTQNTEEMDRIQASATRPYYAEREAQQASYPYPASGVSVATEQATPPHGNADYQSADSDGYPPNSPLPQAGPAPLPPQDQKRSGGRVRTVSIIALTLVILLVLGVGLFAGWEFGHNSSVVVDNSSSFQQGSQPKATIPALSNNNIEAVREAVIANVRPAIVEIDVTSSQGQGLGSGVIIDKNGYIVTNYHVVQGAQTVSVVLSNGSVQNNVQVVGVDPADDLAVVKINPPSNIVVAPLGDSSKLVAGQDVLAIGNPLGNSQTVTNGIVSALGRSAVEPGGATLPNLIQTDAPINPGNSGGALVDLQGQVIGIPTLAAENSQSQTQANGIGFAIPSNRVKFIVPQIIQTGKVEHTGRAGLGVSLVSVDSSVQMQDNLAVNHGALIVNESSNGAAAKAGLQTGDVIVQIDSTQVTDASVVSDILVNKNPGDTISMKVYRGNQQLTLNVKLGELQAQAG